MIPDATVLGAAVVSVLVQGIWIALAAGIVLRAARSRPRVRYAVARGSLALLALAFPLTVAGLLVARSRPAAGVGGAPFALLPWLALVWGVAAVGAALRLALGLAEVHRLRRRGRPVTDRRVLAAFAACRGRAGVRAALVETDVDSPCAAGWRRPAVLVPHGFAGMLGPEHRSAVLAHEVAHLRRRDYPAAVAAAAAAVVVGFHPVTWWLDATAREACEEACDDDVARSVDPLVYARALERLERVRQRRAVRLAPAAAPTLRRVRRLLESRGLPRAGVRRAAFAALLLLVAFGVYAPADVVRRGQALAATLPLVRIQATDGAGAFTMSLRAGRVVAATVAGRPVPRDRLVQSGEVVQVLDDGGATALTVRVHPDGAGISWQSRRSP